MQQQDTHAGLVSKNNTGAAAALSFVQSIPQLSPHMPCAVQKLQLAQGLEAEKARQLTLDHYIGQVGHLTHCSMCFSGAWKAHIDIDCSHFQTTAAFF